MNQPPKAASSSPIPVVPEPLTREERDEMLREMSSALASLTPEPEPR